MPTGTQIIDQLLDQAAGLGWKFSGTAASAGAVVTTTDPEINKWNPQDASGRLEGKFLYIPTGTVGTDQLHTIVSHVVSGATSTITTLGTYAATYTGVAMYILGIHPTVLRNLINDGLELETANVTLPICEGTDWDMQTSGVTNWSDTPDATPTKETTPANVLYGVRGLRVLSNNPGGYSESLDTVRIPRGRQLRAWAIGRADVGSAVATLVDATGNTLTTMETTEEQFVYMWQDVNPGTTAEEVTWRLGGSGASDDSYWAAVGVDKPGESVIYLKNWADERFKVKAVSVASFHGGTDSTNRQAMSRQLRALRPASDYRYENEQVSVNPHYLELSDQWCRYNSPLFVNGLVPYSYFGTLSADTDSTLCPLLVIVPRCMYLLSQRYEAFAGLGPAAAADIRKRALKNYTFPPKVEPKMSRQFSV